MLNCLHGITIPNLIKKTFTIRQREVALEEKVTSNHLPQENKTPRAKETKERRMT